MTTGRISLIWMTGKLFTRVVGPSASQLRLTGREEEEENVSKPVESTHRYEDKEDEGFHIFG